MSHAWGCKYSDFLTQNIQVANLVNDIFWEEEAKAILSIPISIRNAPDKFIWRLSVDGSFTVKSAYSATLSIKGRNKGEISTSMELSRFWKSIWDTTVDIKSNKMSIGIIIRNDMGAVMVCQSSFRTFFSHPIIAKGWALLRAMELSRTWLLHVDFEGDAQVLIQAIDKEQECLAWYGMLVKEIKCILKLRPQWDVSFFSTEGNCAAHVLAKYGLSLDR